MEPCFQGSLHCFDFTPTHSLLLVAPERQRDLMCLRDLCVDRLSCALRKPAELST